MSRLNQFSNVGAQTLNVEWEAAHDEFHQAIVSACSSPWLLEFIEVVRLQSARYRHISVRAKPTADRDVKGEHQAILDAVLARDADLAIERLCAHFNKSTTNALTEGLVGQGVSGAVPLLPMQKMFWSPPIGTPKADPAGSGRIRKSKKL